MTSDRGQMSPVRAPAAPPRTPREHISDGLSMASSRPRSAPLGARRRAALKTAEEGNRDGTDAYDQLRYELATVRRQLEMARAESQAQALKAEEARQSLLAARSPAVELAKDEAQANPPPGSRAQPSKPAMRKGLAPPGRPASARPTLGTRRVRPQALTPRAARTLELAKRAEARRAGGGDQPKSKSSTKAPREDAAGPKRGGTELPPAESPKVWRDSKFRTTSSVIGSWVDTAKPLDTQRTVNRGRPKFIWDSPDHPHWKAPPDRSASSWRPTSASIGHEECWRPLMASQQRAEVPDMQRTSHAFLLTLNKELDENGKNGFLGGQRL